jgi:hypothetical protein
MIYPKSNFDAVVLRLNVNDDWSVEEFAGLLTTVVEAYTPIEQLRVLSRVVDEEASVRVREPVWSALYSNSYSQPFGRNFRDLLTSMHPFCFPLTVGAIRISSPGWIKVVGSLNPLKVVAKFITDYRTENTKRTEIDADVYKATEHEKTERMRIQADLAAQILGMLPEHARVQSAHRVIDISHEVIEPSRKALESIVEDERVKSAEILRLGSGSEESHPE